MSTGPLPPAGYVPSHGEDDGGESTLSGYSREYPTQPDKFEWLAEQAPAAQGAKGAGEFAELLEQGPHEVEEPTEEMIDEAIEESFPASDPPSYPGSSGEVTAPRDDGEEELCEG
jgi:hypothetical protein